MEKCCDNHDRLDLIRHIEDYQDPKCGTISPFQPGRVNPKAGKPDYCCFDCPVLKLKK